MTSLDVRNGYRFLNWKKDMYLQIRRRLEAGHGSESCIYIYNFLFYHFQSHYKLSAKSLMNNKAKSFEERKEQYEKVRSKIFKSCDESGGFQVSF